MLPLRRRQPAGMRFCGQCGAPLGSACPSCGASNPAEHKFCGQCGAPLDGPGLQDAVSPEPYRPRPRLSRSVDAGNLPGEMKQVTVLFCDIVGSTPMTERLGAEAMRDLVSSFLEESLAEVHRYGGTAPQFTGDGFMALFGAPITQEDHVRRALLAAVAIQRALSGSAEHWRGCCGAGAGADGHPYRTRRLWPGQRRPANGLHGDRRHGQCRRPTAGSSRARNHLGERDDPSAGSRLCALEPVGPLALKGKDEPIVAYRLLGVSHRRSGLRETVPAHTTTFVDRESERAILHNFLRQVENGHSQAVGIVGEPGIGKSRLLAEFRRDLADGRVNWVEGRCVSYGTAIPYLAAPRPAAQQLRDCRERHPRNDHREGPLGAARGWTWTPSRTAPSFSIFWVSGSRLLAGAAQPRSGESESLRDLPPA